MNLLLTSLLDDVKKLLEMGTGDTSRLEHIKQTLEQNKTMYTSDKDYLEKLTLVHLRNITEDESKYQEPHSANSKSELIDEMNIEELKRKIRTDKKNTAKLSLDKSGSWSRAFGRGVGGIFLFLFGMGMIFLLYYYFDNIDDYARGMYYGGDPLVMIIYFFVVIPLILLTIGGASIYYGIRIIAKT